MRHVMWMGIVATASAPAFGGVAHMTFTYSELVGTYQQDTNPNFGNFTAVAGGSSSGDVTRLTGGGGTAERLPDFIASLGADVYISLDVSIDQNNPQLAQGVGNLVLTDADGDTITADIYGVFLGGGFGDYFFDGYLTNVFLNTDDGFFHGTIGAADMNLPGNGPYEGLFVELTFAGGTGFFGTDFTSSTLASGVIIPAPISLAALGLGCCVTGRRRSHS